jgi:hypothetical protein
MATHKRILLAGRIYTPRTSSHLGESSTTPQERIPGTDCSRDRELPFSVTSNTTSAEYNHLCRMLLRANTRKYCERCSYYGNCLLGAGGERI